MVFFDNVANPKSRNGPALGVENELDLVVAPVAGVEVALDGHDGFLPKENIALLVSFAGEGDLVRCFQAKIINLKINDFRDTGARVVEQKK